MTLFIGVSLFNTLEITIYFLPITVHLEFSTVIMCGITKFTLQESLLVQFTIIMVSTILIDDLFDLLKEFKNISDGIDLPFDEELFHCCDFYFDCGYSKAGKMYEAYVSLSNKLVPGTRKDTKIVLISRDDL